MQTISAALFVVFLGLGTALRYHVTSTAPDIDVCAQPADSMTVEQCRHEVQLARSAGD